MPRTIPPGRFDRILRCATEEFIARGYRRTQMADVAVAVGVSKATLYLYVESKEALFALCLLHADDREEVPLPDALPVPTPDARAFARQVEQRIREGAPLRRLGEALACDTADDVGAELRAILAELYDALEASCCGIKLLDRSWDHPELGDIWTRVGRQAPRRRLADYMALRMRQGGLRSGLEPRLAARLAIESIATWAVHIKWDRAPEEFEPVSTREHVIEFIARGLLAPPRAPEDEP